MPRTLAAKLAQQHNAVSATQKQIDGLTKISASAELITAMKAQLRRQESAVRITEELLRLTQGDPAQLDLSSPTARKKGVS